MWISPKYTYVPSLLNLPCTLPHPTPLGYHRAQGWSPCLKKQLPTGCFTYGNIHVSVLLSPFVSLSPSSTVSMSLLSMSESLFLPCEYIHQYHFEWGILNRWHLSEGSWGFQGKNTGLPFPSPICMWELDYKKAERQRIDAFELCWRRLLRVPWTARRSNQSILKKLVLNIHWKDWCWNWNSNTLATWCKEPTHWKRPWCWERLKVGGEGDDRGWDGWMVSLTQWTWVWVSSRSWWWTGRPGALQSMGSLRVGHDRATELSWPIRVSAFCLVWRSQA